MPVLIIGEIERARIAEIIAYAMAHVMPIDKVRANAAACNADTITLKDRKPGCECTLAQEIVFLEGYRAAFSIEENMSGLCTHLSVSVFGPSHLKGMRPSPHAVAMIAEAFHVPFPANGTMWQEEFAPGEFAINLLSVIAPGDPLLQQRGE